MALSLPRPHEPPHGKPDERKPAQPYQGLLPPAELVFYDLLGDLHGIGHAVPLRPPFGEADPRGRAYPFPRSLLAITITLGGRRPLPFHNLLTLTKNLSGDNNRTRPCVGAGESNPLLSPRPAYAFASLPGRGPFRGHPGGRGLPPSRVGSPPVFLPQKLHFEETNTK